MNWEAVGLVLAGSLFLIVICGFLLMLLVLYLVTR